ncbi:MAG: hypothetical protein KJ677_07865 [Gammaproteobacteria bacterium]|nr:hypothetical protein [Gammaproteobacteria bacterium]MBV1734072.1 hypothetical protein [Hydrogenophaga sp.]
MEAVERPNRPSAAPACPRDWAARSRDWPRFGSALPLMQAEAKQIDGALAALLSAPPAA